MRAHQMAAPIHPTSCPNTETRGSARAVEPQKPRPIVVQKFGGSSVSDVEKIGRVADRVAATARAGNDVVVVVSAMGKTTDSLLALARSAAELDAGSDTRAKHEPARRELDMLLSTGERVSMSLLSIALQARGLPAISFTGSQSGILTNDRHFDARIIEVRPHRIEDELARGKIVIVAGYQGMSYRREITTLGRGGSDTTAVALAAALQADRCEIYSDVDGVYSADPRAVPDAAHLPELDHEMLQEMAEAGAKVVCAQAVEWARRRGIAIHARSTFDDRRETVVRATRTEQVVARAIVCEPKVLFGVVEAPLDKVIGALAEASVAFKDLSFAGGRASFVVPLLNVPHPAAAVALLERCLGDALTLHPEASLVSVVGDGLAARADALARFAATLATAGVAPLAVHAGPLRLSAVVPAGKDVELQRALHADFVSG